MGHVKARRLRLISLCLSLFSFFNNFLFIVTTHLTDFPSVASSSGASSSSVGCSVRVPFGRAVVVVMLLCVIVDW